MDNLQVVVIVLDEKRRLSISSVGIFATFCGQRGMEGVTFKV